MSLVEFSLHRLPTRSVKPNAKLTIAGSFCGSRASARSLRSMASPLIDLLSPVVFPLAMARITRSTASGLFGRSRIERKASALTSSTPSESARRETNSTCNWPSLLRSPSNRSAQTCAPVSVEMSWALISTLSPRRRTLPSSVPASFANRRSACGSIPSVSSSPPKGRSSANARRAFARSHQRESTTTVFDWRHYLAAIQRKPAHSATARRSPNSRRLPKLCSSACLRRRRRPQMVDIRPRSSSMTSRPVLTAVELALEAGAPTKTHILNVPA